MSATPDPLRSRPLDAIIAIADGDPRMASVIARVMAAFLTLFTASLASFPAADSGISFDLPVVPDVEMKYSVAPSKSMSVSPAAMRSMYPLKSEYSLIGTASLKPSIVVIPEKPWLLPNSLWDAASNMDIRTDSWVPLQSERIRAQVEAVAFPSPDSSSWYGLNSSPPDLCQPSA